MDVATALRLSGLPSLERRVLLQSVLKRSHAWLIAHGERTLDAAQEALYRQRVAQRETGIPIAYLTGEREFYGRTFNVGPEVLIPRPDTEGLVDWALESRGASTPFTVLDLGTGSGAIAVTLQCERPDWHITATDRSDQALAMARHNARQRLSGAPRTPVFRVGNWFEAVGDERFDLILSNPPYIAALDPHLQQGDLRFEPSGALSPGPLGTEDLERLIANASFYLRPSGQLLLEHGHDQGEGCRHGLRQAGFVRIETRRDLGGLERWSGGTRPNFLKPV